MGWLLVNNVFKTYVALEIFALFPILLLIFWQFMPIELRDCSRCLEQSIQKWTKWNLWKTAFKKFHSDHSWVPCLIWCYSGFSSWYIKGFLQILAYWFLYKFKLYGIIKICFILLSDFVVIKNFEMLWSTSQLLSVRLMQKYLRIFFPIFFALNEQEKVK